MQSLYLTGNTLRLHYKLVFLQDNLRKNTTQSKKQRPALPSYSALCSRGAGWMMITMTFARAWRISCFIIAVACIKSWKGLARCQPIRCFGYDLTPRLASLNNQSQDVNKSWSVQLHGCPRLCNTGGGGGPSHQSINNSCGKKLSVGYYVALLNICPRYSAWKMFIHGNWNSFLSP
jgi:putative component of membrane protein insertase Oxa1/YidC/SpoIIIJ protein YidD